MTATITDRSTVLSARDLVKTYPGGRGKESVTALDGVSFTAEPGTVLGLLGPNGAGKSTTVKILTTLSRADSGTAYVAGHDISASPGEVRRLIGFVAQKPVTDPMDTGRENLELAARIHGQTRRDARLRANELLDRFNLTDAADRLVRTYSGGMARKLDVAIGLVNRPQVLFLDEPTTGLDPQARSEMWQEVGRLAGEDQMTILLTTHYLDEADHLAAHLVIVDEGHVVAEGSPDALKSELRGDTVIIELASEGDVSAARAALDRLPEPREFVVDGAVLRGRADHGGRALPGAIGVLEAAGIAIESATVSRPSLDDVYLKHTGRSFTAAKGDES
ncbi:ABC-2 type transport system ATP-binding protein [Antricoccus suffuscus]|uniref:ABC-2 type transport system ATP-binding protein n=1 Tax=Antricoccus suffuscus TaxID=1629062 RepID=A0A2T1A7V1_9ACTN|nr:ABC transporter ATP-binding protein [Antricoccus suffuscus]PRZ44418.1 ABC-2 type transport system ATP-binding protein [Antricoccus suffuscus]